MGKKEDRILSRINGRFRTYPTIGLLLENRVGMGEYQAEVWLGVADAAAEYNANLVSFAGGTLGDRPNEFQNSQNVVYDLASINNVDGLIVSGTLGTFVNPEEFKKFIARFNQRLPIVSTVMSVPGTPSVMVDNQKGMREMLLHLIQHHGYRKIGFIRGPKYNPDAAQRYQVYLDVLAEQGIPCDESWVVSGDFLLSSGETALDQLLQKNKFDALVAANDNMALGALKALRKRGINVPQELAVVGFDDTAGARDVTPSLTTVVCPAYEQGKRAAEMLLDLLLSGKKIRYHETLPTRLKLRESCGCPDPTIEQARTGLTARAGAADKSDLMASRETILAEVQRRVFVDLIVDSWEERTDQLLDAFYAEISDDKPARNFLSSLDQILRLVTDSGGNVSEWHTVVSVMRQNILPLIHDDETLFRAEDLWQQARVMVGKRSRRVEGSRRLDAEQRTGKLNELAQELDTTSDPRELIDILVNGLRQLGIQGCFLSLYENPAAPTNQCRSVLVYRGQQGVVQLPDDGRLFPPDQLMPRDALIRGQFYNLIVEPLYYRENQLGIVVFQDMEPYEGETCETLRSQLSSALWRAHLDQYLHALSEASAQVMSIREPDEILREAMNHARKIVGAFSIRVALVTRNRELRRVIVGGERGKSVPLFNLVGETALQSMETRQPVLIENTKNSGAFDAQEIAKAGLGAAGCFPMFIRNVLLGVIWIYYENPHYFPAAEVNALKLYANQTVIAYDNAKRMKELEHLQQASEKLASVADVRDVLQQITESAYDVLAADSVAIWSYDAIKRTFLPDELVSKGIPDEMVAKFKLDKPSPGGTAETVIREGYLAVNNVDDPKYEYLGPPQTHGLRGAIGVRSFQGVVLRVGNDALGVIYVNYRIERDFGDEEKSTLMSFAHHAALALKKARLLEQVRRMYDTARVVTEISVQEDLQSTLNAIAEGTRQALQCDAVTLNSYNPVTNELGYPPAMSGVTYPKLVQRLKRGSIIYDVLQREEPYVVEAVSQNPDFKDRRFVKDERIKSCVAIPLKVKAIGPKVGVMFVNYRAPHQFTGQEINDIKLFANQAAVSIWNAQLYDQATSKAQYLQALYDAGKTVTSTLTLDEILKRIVDQASLLAARQGQPPIFCYLALKEDGKLKLKVSYSVRKHESHLVQKSVIIDLERDQRIGIIGRAVKTGKSQLVLDVTKDPDYIVDKPETKSVFAVPISIGEDVLGVIAIGHSSNTGFDEEDCDCLESLSTQAALAIHNAQLYADATAQARYLQALYEAGTAVTSTLSFDEIVERIVKQVYLITGSNGKPADLVQIGLIEGTKLRKKVWRSDSPLGLQNMASIIDLQQDTAIGIMGRVVKTGQSVLSHDVTQEADYLEYDPKTRSELAVPIKLGEKIIGVINAEHPDYAAFDDADQKCLESLATQVAIAIENARYVKEIQQRALQMQTASKVARDAASILSIEQLLNQAVNLISDRFHFYHAAIFLLEKEYALLKAASSKGGQQMLQEGHKLKIGEDGIVGRVAKTGELRMVDEVDKDGDFLRNRYLLDTHSEMALPLQIHGQLIGVLDVQFNEPNTLPREDIATVQMMADQLAIAIHNARQYDELRQTKGLVGASTALAWMGMASNTWRHTIDKHARTIVEQIDLLRGDLIQILQLGNYDRVENRLAIVQRLARQIEEKPITPPLSSEEGVVSVQINVLIRERIARLWDSEPYKSVIPRLTLTLGDRFTVRASPEWLRRALDILIDNAVAAMIDSSLREITIKTSHKDNRIEILISDTGKGIPAEIFPHIFVNPIKKMKGAKGLGVGLLMAQVIVQTYGGEIGVASTDSGGTAMFIRLPLEP